MKKSLLKTLAFVALAAISASAFAKTNPKVATYKTQEVADSSADKSAPLVYFIRDITPEALVKVYQATGYKTSGKTGVKVSTGESENSNYLRPALIKNVALLRNASRVFTL